MRREWSVAGAFEMTTPRQSVSEEKSGAPLREDGVEAQAAAKLKIKKAAFRRYIRKNISTLTNREDPLVQGYKRE